MKRLLMLAALSLAAVPLYAMSADAQAPVTASDVVIATTRGFTERVTAVTTPKRDKTRPFTFTTRGKIFPPGRFCDPGAGPTAKRGPGNCIPIICPPGSLNRAYCQVPPASVICSGTVTVRFQKGRTTVSARVVPVRPDCTYSSTVSFRLLLSTRRGRLKVKAFFSGNVLLTPQSSTKQTVRAG